MAKGDMWQCTASSGLRIRQNPTTSSTCVGLISKGQIVVEVSQSNGWLQISSGWCSMEWLDFYSAAVTPTTTTENATSATDQDMSTYYEESGLNSDGSGYQPDTNDIYSYSESREFNQIVGDEDTFKDLESVVGVFGLPYQFMPSADTRIPTSSEFSKSENPYSYWSIGIGSEYADRIIAKMPLLFMAPGRPNFMTKYSKTDKENILSLAINKFSGDENGTLEDLIDSDGRYYTFENAASEYYNYVNPMCRIAARYLELQDFSLGGKFNAFSSLDQVNWSEYTMGTTTGINNATTFTHIPFYLDSDTSVSDSFSNSTTQSSLASTVNGISDLGRELQFLTGYTSRALDSDWLQENADVSAHLQNIQDTVEGLLGSKNFISNLSRHLTSVASGGRLIFPEIWNESHLSRSYNVKIKLVAPDCTKLSVFLNVLVPLFHLIGFVAPQSMSDNPNGFTSPFLVRAIYKSFFNVDMGIITDMSVTRGGNCLWTVDGLPTSIEVDITIKDLYDVLAITPSSSKNWSYDTLSNTAQMDYIANLCGINMYRPEIGRMISMWLVNGSNKLVDIPRNIWRNINESIGSGITGILRGIS